MKYLLSVLILLTQICAHSAQQDPHDSQHAESPTILEHHEHTYIPGRKISIEENIIYFETDASGKPSYKKISAHEKDNPHFSTIRLIAYHAAFWPFYDEYFENIGTYGDHKQLTLFKAHMSNIENWHAGGVWCPQLNTMIGGTKDTAACDRFSAYMTKQTS